MIYFMIINVELSEYEAAALEEARKIDIRNMKSTIDSGMTDTTVKINKDAGEVKDNVKKGNRIEHLRYTYLIRLFKRNT